jgi:3-methyladenine DNA glycosylase AlkC
MRRCASDENYHVRRFASEGSRPFLPWAQRVDLPLEQVISILDLLYADPTRYVTRSVANAMNDITKIDAELAVRTLKQWRKLNLQTPDEFDWMLRHATRGLLKQGHPSALKLLDYTAEPLVEISNLATTKQLLVGEAFNWQCNLVSGARQKLKITLHIHFLKANGSHAPKAFAVRDADFLKGETVLINKRLSFKPITTRTLYPGQHSAELVINGVSYAKRCFDLRT